MKFNPPAAIKSMIQTTAVITNVAANTIMVDCCNWVQVGQVTFSRSSLYESLK